MYLAAGAFFSVKMAIQDFTSPVAANQLAAGAFFSVKMAYLDLTSPVLTKMWLQRWEGPLAQWIHARHTECLHHNRGELWLTG